MTTSSTIRILRRIRFSKTAPSEVCRIVNHNVCQRVFACPCHREPPNHELISLFRFSLRFSRSTRFRCIFSAIFSYRSFSSFFSRLALIAWILS
jgi:hypothetical protein